MEKLLQNPERYRIGKNYRASNIVFPVEFEGSKLIIKMPHFFSSLVNTYYVLQNYFFYRTRKISTAEQRFEREAECLEKLKGVFAPKLESYKRSILVRQYIEGRDFRTLLLDEERRKALTLGLEGLVSIHGRDITIGDAHVKNIFLSSNSVYWMDFEGVFCQNDLAELKAIDLLTFVYSTYSTTKNKDITLYCAELIKKYPNRSVKAALRRLITSQPSTIMLWFPTRLPLDGRLNKEIKSALTII